MHIRSGFNKALSESSYPKFNPHITLATFDVSSVPLHTICSSIPTSQPSLTVDFKSIAIGSHYFRSVYLTIKPTHDLSTLHEHIHTTLGIEFRTPSFPHISLCYIDDDDAKAGERENFLREMESSGKVLRDGEDGVSLNCGEHGGEDWLAGFKAPEIWIVECEGPVEGWQILEKVPLQ